MSDFNSSLPIRTENAGDVVSKIADATIPSRQLTVNANGSLNVEAANLDIRDLTFAQDKVDASGSVVTLDSTTLAALESITVQNPGGASAVNVQDGGNSLTVDAVDLDIRNLVFATDKVDTTGSIIALDAPTLAALESITVQNGAGASAVNIQDGGNSLTVDAIDLDIRDLTHVSDSVKVGDGTDFLAVNTDGSINVVIQNDVPGTEICNRQTSTSVASNVSVNHDYTVTALKTFTGEQVVCAGSGKIKVQVLFNGVIKFDAFNSAANPTVIIPLLRMIKASAGQIVRITVTNLDNQAQDLYSTLMGSETP